MSELKYHTPKDFLKKVDLLYLVFLGVPLVGFLIYYFVVFVVNSYQNNSESENVSVGAAISVVYILIGLALWIFRISKFKKLRLEFDINKKLDQLNRVVVQVFVIYLILLSVAFVILYIEGTSFFSLPGFIMFAIISLEKPQLSKLAIAFRFKDKTEYKKFVRNEPFENIEFDLN